jgi:predicted transcriptional regulator
MKQVLITFVCFTLLLSSVAGWQLWSEHNQIADLQFRLGTLSAKITETQKTESRLSKNQKTLNYNQDQLVEAIKSIIRALKESENPDTSYYKNKDPRNKL